VSRFTTQVRFWTGFVVTSVSSVIFIAVVVLLLPWRQARVRLCNFYGKCIGRFNMGVAGARPVKHHWERIEASRPAIYISNHTSTLDIWMGMWACPYGGVGVAKKELLRVPFFGQLYGLSGHPLIDRSNRERAVSTLNDLTDFVRKNRLSIWIWPEGTRSRSGELGPFKKGLFHMAIATRYPVVPLVIWGAQQIWPIVPVRRLRFQPNDLHIEVMEPVDTSGWELETLETHMAELHELIRQRIDEGPPPER